MIDIEAILTTFLRAQTAVADLAADRVYTDLPHERTYPLVVLSRTGGGFLINRPQWLEAAELVIDAYGGSREDAQALAVACTGPLAQLPGRYPEGAVTKATVAAMRYNPDPESPDDDGHARPRFTAEVVVVAHP